MDNLQALVQEQVENNMRKEGIKMQVMLNQVKEADIMEMK